MNKIAQLLNFSALFGSVSFLHEIFSFKEQTCQRIQNLDCGFCFKTWFMIKILFKFHTEYSLFRY